MDGAWLDVEMRHDGEQVRTGPSVAPEGMAEVCLPDGRYGEPAREAGDDPGCQQVAELLAMETWLLAGSIFSSYSEIGVALSVKLPIRIT
jgi:hypothetical protein